MVNVWSSDAGRLENNKITVHIFVFDLCSKTENLEFFYFIFHAGAIAREFCLEGYILSKQLNI